LSPLLLLRLLLLRLLDLLLLLRPLLLSLLGPLLLRLLRLSLRALLLCGRLRTLLLPALLLLGLALSFVLLVWLHCGDNRPEKQKQGSGTGSSNESHGNRPPLRSLSNVHADGQSASTMFHRLCCLRLGLGLVQRPIRVVGRYVIQRSGNIRPIKCPRNRVACSVRGHAAALASMPDGRAVGDSKMCFLAMAADRGR
jgi:hypothetical protein